MRLIRLKKDDCLTDEETKSLAGKLMGDDCYNILVEDECKVLKPDGSVLLILKPDSISKENCRLAYKNLKDAARPTSNRGVSTGIEGEGKKVKRRRSKKNGTLSNTLVAVGGNVNSGIVGYFDRTPRFPYCRTTAYNLSKGHKFQEAMPFIRNIDSVFSEAHPTRYEKQKAMVMNTSPDFVIHGTAFTTVTVNLNWQTAVHLDKGDYMEGFGVMSAICAGEFDGAYLCFPQYKVAANVRTGSVLLADVHEWHCNTPFKGIPGAYERLSFVLYYRSNMLYCGTAEEELNRAKNRKLGMKLNVD